MDDVDKCQRIYRQMIAGGFPTMSQLEIIDWCVRMVTRPQFEIDMRVLAEHLAEVRAKKQALLDQAFLDSPDSLMSDAQLAAKFLFLGVTPPMKESKTTGKEQYAFAKTDKAFQAMLDQCETPYYVQVDEDMLLYPDAIQRLHDELRGAPDDIAFVVGYLHDVHLEQPVQGVKIFRHAIVRRYPFADVQSCELDQVDRLRADGFAYRVLPAGTERSADDTEFPYAIVGLHGATHSPRSIYERFRTLEMARRKHPRRFSHQERWPVMLVERFLERRNPLDFYALMGLLAGALSPTAARREKDFRTYSSLPGFDRAMDFMRDAAGDDGAT